MQVGDLVKRRATGQFFIYCGNGAWAGWGQFANFKGRIRQLQVIEMEIVEKNKLLRSITHHALFIKAAKSANFGFAPSH